MALPVALRAISASQSSTRARAILGSDNFGAVLMAAANPEAGV
jgi:hypothetical protein